MKKIKLEYSINYSLNITNLNVKLRCKYMRCSSTLFRIMSNGNCVVSFRNVAFIAFTEIKKKYRYYSSCLN